MASAGVQAGQRGLGELLEAPACLVSGAPGCGKSSAVSAAASQRGTLVRLTLQPGADPAPQLARKLGVELANAEELPIALEAYGASLLRGQGVPGCGASAPAAPAEHIILVLDDADELIARLSRTALRRLSEHGCPQLHVVLVCSTLARPQALRQARAALPHLDRFGVELPPEAGRASWGWAAGAQELLALLGEGGDLSAECPAASVDLLMAQSLEELLWPRLDAEGQRALMLHALNWKGECSVPFDEARTLPVLPATRVERDRVLFHPAYKLMMSRKLAALAAGELAALHRELAELYLRMGKQGRCIAHALDAGDWACLAGADPFALLYGPDCALLERAAGLLMAGGVGPAQDECPRDHAKSVRFTLRLAAALAVAGSMESAQALLELAETAPDAGDLRNDIVACQLIIAGSGFAAPSASASWEATTPGDPLFQSRVFRIEDLAAADIEGTCTHLLMGCLSAGGGSEERLCRALGELFGQPALEVFALGITALLRCDFFRAKQLLQQTLFAAEQGGCVPLQRSSLASLVGLDSVQGNFSGARRFLDALERLPVAVPGLDEHSLEQCRAFAGLAEGSVEDIPGWLRSGELRLGINIAASRWLTASAKSILYLLKRRRSTKARTRLDYVMAQGVRSGCSAEEGFLLLLQACCELDVGTADAADALLARSCALLKGCGVLFPLALAAAFDPRFRAFVASQAPEAVSLIETSERELSAQRALKEEALRKPASGKLALLTEREYEVASMAAGGYQNKEIAARLFITERTVKEHLTRTYKKLGVSDRQALGELMLREQMG